MKDEEAQSANKTIQIGIGFATGRTSFQTVLKTNVYNWRECGLTHKSRVLLNLFIAYDLKYSNTKRSDYTNIAVKVRELIDDAFFIGAALIQRECDELVAGGVITQPEARLFFASGYAAKRNAILYLALKQGMDYLIFLDDDEYPLAVTHGCNTELWSGQQVLATHLQYIEQADLTSGHHCGYISPIPHIVFDQALPEATFRRFIEAISNDIVSWQKQKQVMEQGGVTYADKDVLKQQIVEEVPQTNGAKFISGSNLCLNLTRPERLHPFYNPPKARGEDTFLSTCLSENRVLRVPCYNFHDAFSIYRPLMNGVLPVSLKRIHFDGVGVSNRFYKACLGWIRYKPLYLYLTQTENYGALIEQMQQMLRVTLPQVAAYFQNPDFLKLEDELRYYNNNVHKHFQDFQTVQQIWRKLQQHLVKYQ